MAIAAASLLVFAAVGHDALADSLVQQWRLPDRFAYGTLAALPACRALAADWTASALRGGAGPTALACAARGRAFRRLVALLVLAVRHAERLALAMDARGFGRGAAQPLPATCRGPLDRVVVGLAGVALLGRGPGPGLIGRRGRDRAPEPHARRSCEAMKLCVADR